MRSPKMDMADVQENVWIEIIRKMESIYAQLADSQAEMEKRTQELVEAKELSDNIIRSMSDAVVALDDSGRVTRVNDTVRQLFGFSREDLVGHSLSAFLPEAIQEQWRWGLLRRRVEQEGTFRRIEMDWRSRDGALIPVEVSGSVLRDRFGEVIGAVLVIRDLRELKRLESELIQAAKMSSLGRLAAGVAHEVNNPLSGILLYGDLLLEDIPKGDKRREHAGKIVELALRCREIVRALLDFARPSVSCTQPVDVGIVLRNVLRVLEPQEMFRNVEVKWDPAGSLPSILGDPTQLQQAFTNIMLNAVEAMQGKGVLTIVTSPESDGPGVVVRISDTGCGIPEELWDGLFEPFFTTKAGGTGLGLAITYEIVERHKGRIEVQSRVGEGTTFILTLRSIGTVPDHE